MTKIAGHTFVDSPTGRTCDCGKTWLQVLADREHWRAGEFGIAHAGALNDEEVESLEQEIARIWDTVTQ